MKVLYIITQADGGGAQKYTLMLAKHFGDSIAAGSEAGKLFEDAKNLQLTTYPLEHLQRAVNPWQDSMAVWEIRRLVKTLQPDIVHLNSSKAGVIGSFAAIGLKTKVVFTAHGFIFNEPLPWVIKSFYLSLEKVASTYRSAIICVSEADHRSALGYKLIDPKKLFTIHNGLEQIKFYARNEARRALSLADGKIIIGCVANFYKTKGVDVLIQAISLLDEQTKQKIQVVLIGNGPEFENCNLEIGNLQLKNIITTLGKTENASQYLEAFDILAIPSRKEGFPFAVLEAMQAGLPVIATEVGGIPEALGDAGILVEPENPGALAEAIKNLVSDTQKQKALSRAALERAKMFTAQKMLEETKKVYEAVLKK